MSRFEPRSFTEILKRMSYRVVARTSLTDLNDGGGVHTVLAGVARELDDINFQMINLQRIWDLDTATGTDLDDRALDLNPDKMIRRQATAAVGTVVFSRADTVGAVAIPIGTVVRVPGGGPAFATSAAGTIPDGSASSAAIAILAEEAGEIGPIAIGAITELDAVTGVETVTNTVATTAGQDLESDARFRERIKAYLRSLPRGTPDALKFAVLSTELDGFGVIVTAEVIELEGSDLGRVIIYVDDGTGTIETTDNNVGTPESVVSVATGGEERVFLLHKPVHQDFAVDVELNAAPLVEDTDYTLNYATGQITLTTALAPGDAVTAEYYWYEGLIAEAQKIVDGDPLNRTVYPGYRAAGTIVFVLPPLVLQQAIAAQVVVASGFDGATVRNAVASAISRYINALGINGDVIRSELIAAAQSVAGVIDVNFTTPAGNVVIGEGELARVTIANINLT